MRFGAHVGRPGGLEASFRRAVDIGAEAAQMFTQSPRMWRPTLRGPQELGSYLGLRERHPEVGQVFFHATYLINLATPDGELAARSRRCLASNLDVVVATRSDGLILHVGSHKGAGLEGCLGRIAEALVGALDRAGSEARILLENTAGGGGTIGRSFAELAAVIDAAGNDERIGVCLDSQHLWASGVDYSTPAAADAAMEALASGPGLGRLRCLHLNESQVPFGSNRDRHANLGEGTIGDGPLGCLLGHPELQGLPAILEVAGRANKGADASDLERARDIHRRGMARRLPDGRKPAASAGRSRR